MVSKYEGAFISKLHSLNLRADGRDFGSYRQISIEENIIKDCVGSIRMILGDKENLESLTEIILTLNTDMVVPTKERPDSGIVNLKIDTSTPFEEDEIEAESISKSILSRLQKDLLSIDIIRPLLNELCIKKGEFAWRISITCLIISSSGPSIIDTISLGINLLLKNILMPNVTIETTSDKGVELILDQSFKKHLFYRTPIFITVLLTEDLKLIIDPTYLESSFSMKSILCVLLDINGVCMGIKVVDGTFPASKLISVMEMAKLALTNNINKVL